MAKVEGYACDVCNQFNQTRDDGWYSVVPFSGNAADAMDATVEVCSPSCLVRLARDMVKAETALTNGELEHEVKQAVIERRNSERESATPTDPRADAGEPAPLTPTDLAQCDECGQFFKPHGLGMHKTRVHQGVKWDNVRGKIE